MKRDPLRLKSSTSLQGLGIDAEAVELDLVLPVVTGRQDVGEYWATGLDEPQEHAQFLEKQAASRHWGGPPETPLLLKADAPGLS